MMQTEVVLYTDEFISVIGTDRLACKIAINLNCRNYYTNQCTFEEELCN